MPQSSSKRPRMFTQRIVWMIWSEPGYPITYHEDEYDARANLDEMKREDHTFDKWSDAYVSPVIMDWMNYTLYFEWHEDQQLWCEMSEADSKVYKNMIDANRGRIKELLAIRKKFNVIDPVLFSKS